MNLANCSLFGLMDSLLPIGLTLFGSPIRDLKYVAVLGLVLALLTAVAWLVLRLRGINPIDFLTRDEWRIFFKLAGIVFFLLLLLLTEISVEYPAEMFIYGRF